MHGTWYHQSFEDNGTKKVPKTTMGQVVWCADGRVPAARGPKPTCKSTCPTPALHGKARGQVFAADPGSRHLRVSLRVSRARARSPHIRTQETFLEVERRILLLLASRRSSVQRQNSTQSEKEPETETGTERQRDRDRETETETLRQRGKQGVLRSSR